MLLALARKNIKGNLKNYLLYFISAVFDVTIYFAFQNIAYNNQIKEFLQQDYKMLMLFRASAIIIVIFAAIFIAYSSSFFIKKRKKELGLYSLLGLKKKDIATLIFYENMLIGSLAIILGILTGCLLSKLFIMVLLRFIGVNVYVKFAISISAIIYTVVAFGILFLISSAYVCSVIYRFELIDLFKADSLNENQGSDKVKYSVIWAFIAVILLITEAITVTNIKDSPTFYMNTPITLATAIIGTFVFFGSFLSFMGNILKNKKSLYYKGDNLISISHFLYRIKANKKLLAIIAITNAVALTSISISYSINYNMNESYHLIYPFSYCYVTTGKALDKKVETLINNYPQNEMKASAEVELVKLSGKIKDYKSLNFETVYLISEGQYVASLKSKGIKLDLKMLSSDEAILLRYGPTSLDDIKGKTLEIKADDKKSILEIVDRKMVEPLNTMEIGQVLMVKDEVYNKYYSEKNKVVLKAYTVKNNMDSNALSKDIIRIMPEGSYLSYVQDFKPTLILSSMGLFVGILIGLVFLTSTGSILYFKQLTEATDDKARYVVLKKIGISRKEIKKSIEKQVVVIFALPIIIGLFHSLLALTLLSSIIDMSIKVPIIVSVVAYISIYMSYYFITVKTYTKIVTEN